MRIRIAVVSSAIVTLLAIAAVSSNSKMPDGQESGFRVENAKLDVGEIKGGQDAVATFIFHNNGTEPVKIIKAKPS